MGNDFEERLRRAAQSFKQKHTAGENALASLEKTRVNFLEQFQLKICRVIKPVLETSKEHIAPTRGEWSDESVLGKQSLVSANIAWSEGEDRIALEIRHGKVHSAIVFRADPKAVLVRITADSYEVRGSTDYRRMSELSGGTGKDAAVMATLTLTKLKSP